MVDRGIVLDAGTEKPITIPFQLCTPTGCQAVANLAPDFIDTLRKAQKASATVFPIGAQGIQLTLSVKGLADALAALKQPPG
jgi:invasion protein IalB